MSAELKKLVADFGKLPASMRREIRDSAQEIGEPVLREVRRRASWSSRIPAATRIATRFGGRTAGVTVKTSQRKAPHARPYEHGGDPGFFRVPVFRRKGRATPWVNRAARPFFNRGVLAAQPAVTEAFADVVLRVGARNGWHP